MSAIAGVLGQGPAATRRVQRMCRVLAHRGRGEAVVFGDDRVALGALPHARPGTSSSDDGRYRLACDAYALDAGAIIAAYARSGAEALRALRGPFALALWDRAERTLVLARDRLGIKPLYHRREAGGAALCFASEAKALWVGTDERPRLNPNALCDLLGHLHLSGDETCFAGVSQLPAGHALVVTPSDERLVRYWRPSFAAQAPGDLDEVGHAFAELLRAAVRRRLPPSGPAALALSGGIDSGGLAAIARREGAALRTFALGFVGPERPRQGVICELPRARALATRLGCEHAEIVVRAEDVVAALPAIVARHDQPHAGSMAPWFLAQGLPDDAGVLLSGLGADELLRGHGRCIAMERDVGARLDGGRVGPATRSYYTLDALLPAPERLALLHPDLRKALRADRSAPKAHEAILAEHLGAHMADACLLLDLKTRLGNEYLLATDVALSSRAVESALPFLDEEVVDFVLGLPVAWRDHARPPKLALRLALRSLLPSAYLGLPKAGFALPLGDWLDGPLQPWVRELLSPASVQRRGYFDANHVAHLVTQHETGRRSRPYLVWTLCMIEAWARHHLDGVGLEAPAVREVPHIASAVATMPVSAAAPTCRDLPTCRARHHDLHGDYVGGVTHRPDTIAAVLDVRDLSYADYLTALRRQHRGSAPRHAKKADRAGYLCRPFARELHLPDIVAINRSMPVRSGGPMRGDYLSSLEELGVAPTQRASVEPPACPAHYDAWWGIFEPAPGHRQGRVQVDERLLGYIELRRHGSYALYAKLLGHGAHLHQGIMYRLHLAIMEWLCARADAMTRGIACLVYAGYYQGAPGLGQWKRKVLFRPAHLVEA